MSSMKDSAVGRMADELTRVLEDAEQVIRHHNFGQRAAVAMGVTSHDDVHTTNMLVFGKREGRWGLFRTRQVPGQPALEHDLFTSSIETRILAAELIPALVMALEEARADQAQRIKTACASLSAYLDGIRKDPP